MTEKIEVLHQHIKLLNDHYDIISHLRNYQSVGVTVRAYLLKLDTPSDESTINRYFKALRNANILIQIESSVHKEKPHVVNEDYVKFLEDLVLQHHQYTSKKNKISEVTVPELV